MRAKSNKGFGIHSPFVFRFVTEVLHPQKKSSVHGKYITETDKILRLLLRSIDYYKLNKVAVLSPKYQRKIANYNIPFDTDLQTNLHYDLVLTEHPIPTNQDNFSEQAFVFFIGKYPYPKPSNCNIYLDLYDLKIAVLKKGLGNQEFKLKL